MAELYFYKGDDKPSGNNLAENAFYVDTKNGRMWLSTTKKNTDLKQIGSIISLEGIDPKIDITKINYLKNVGSDIQTQLDGKAASNHTHGNTAASNHTHDDYYDSTLSRNANTVLAAPDGSSGAATFRKLVAADIPNIGAAKITSGTLALAQIPTGTTSTTVALGNHTHSGYASSSHNHDSTYLKLSGGTLTGALCIGVLNARTTSSTTSTSYGAGNSGYVLTSNGTNAYWGPVVSVKYGTSAPSSGFTNPKDGDVYLKI